MPDIFSIQKVDEDLLHAERSKTMRLLKKNLSNAKILEVGSTAIEGTIGKMDVDILVTVSKENFKKTRTVLDSLFPRNPDQLSNECYQGYSVDSPLDIAIQFTIQGGEYDDFEVFMNALKNNPNLVRQYNQLKLDWNGKPMEEYRKAKSAFIEQVLKSI